MLYLNFSSGNQEDFDDSIVVKLKDLLNSTNPYVKTCRMSRDNIRHAESIDVHLKLISKRTHDGRTHNIPSASEVAALIVGDIESVAEERDIIVEGCDGRLNRISELHLCYLALQYPLLFPHGEDSYRLDISHKGVELDVLGLTVELIQTNV